MTGQRGKWDSEPNRYGDEDNRYPKPTLANQRETPSGWIDAQEWNRIVPAARCKECGNVTWKLSLSGGPQKLYDNKKNGPVHEKGCSRPPGRLDRELL